jgi:hypothetical protein
MLFLFLTGPDTLTHPTRDLLLLFNRGATAHVSAAHFSLSLSLSRRHVGPGHQPLTASSPNPLPCPGHARIASMIPTMRRDTILWPSASSRLSSLHCMRHRLELIVPTAAPLPHVAYAHCRCCRDAWSPPHHDEQPTARCQLLHAA